MAHVFQLNVFQHGVFQQNIPAAAGTGSSIPGTGHWRGPARKHRPGIQGRIRRLSELDPPKPLFTPESILEDMPPLDKAALEAMILDGIGRRDSEISRLMAEQEKRRQRELYLRMLADDDDTFMVM